MDRRSFLDRMARGSILLAVTKLPSAPIVATAAQDARPMNFQMSGRYIEACSCSVPCPCPMLEAFREHCTAGFAIAIDSGSFNSVDLSRVRVGWAGRAGKRIVLYIDAPENQRTVARALASALFGDFGSIQDVRASRIELTKEQDKRTLTFDGGRTFSALVEPVLGADGRTPVRIVNALTPWLPTIMQGRTVQGEYRDGDLSFTLRNSNGFFNDDLQYVGVLS